MTLLEKIKNLVWFDLVEKLKSILLDLNGKVSNVQSSVDTIQSTINILSSGAEIITKTKSEIDVLISSNNLEVGSIYKITGVHPTLYNDGTNSGTTIYLTALTTNTLSKEGYGEFWNPKYNQAIDGFGVWNNRSTFVPTASLVGLFTYKENITANNGATGQLVGHLDTITFVALTGDWSTATSFTGNTSGASIGISSVSLKTYSIGDKVFWGGYSWTNVNGLVGAKNNILSLNSEWSKNIYSTADYNKVIDYIEYDYNNDWISRRREVEYDNDVIYVKKDSEYWFPTSAISVFMWGNGWNGTRGLWGNQVYNSYFECVDFCGRRISKNRLKDSVINNNIIIGNSSIRNNELFDDGEITDNTLQGSMIRGNTVKNDSYIYNCTLTANSQISYNVFSQSRIEKVSAVANSQIHNNFFQGSRLQRTYFTDKVFFMNNMLQASYFQDNLFSNNTSTIQNCSMLNSTFAIGTSVDLGAKYISGLVINNAIVNQNISASTIIYQQYDRTVYKRPDGTVKLRYYNDSDVLVITDVTT